MKLQQKKERLQKLKEKIVLQKKKERQIEHELHRKQRQKRTRQLINAGLLFEQAGILGKYDADKEFILGLLYLSSEFYKNDDMKELYKKIGQTLKEETIHE